MHVHAHAESLIVPIDKEQRQQVITSTRDYVKWASSLFDYTFDPVAVRFDLRGRAAGMYMTRQGQRCIRYNPYIFAKNFHHSLNNTVPHEVAHYVTDILFGLRSIRPHGEEWKKVMRAFGISRPRATGDYDLAGVPVRRQKRFKYACDCREHQLTSVRHNKVQHKKARYECRYCGTAVVFMGD